MKILFLDIDGVVNCATTMQRHRGVIGIDPYLALLVDRILFATGAQVVLSSSWRHWEEGREEIRRQVCDFIDCTPRLYEKGRTMERGHEIEAWLKQHPEVEQYAILDDDSDFLPGQPHFKTAWTVGLTQEIVDAVIKHLNNDQI